MTRYLILGGGIAALSAAKAIRENDRSGLIVMISGESALLPSCADQAAAGEHLRPGHRHQACLLVRRAEPGHRHADRPYRHCHRHAEENRLPRRRQRILL